VETRCRHFNGYKPCGLSESCDSTCGSRNLITTRILIIHLEAAGSVLRSTSLLKPIKRKYPGSHITWVTKPIGAKLLEGNPYVDQVFTDSSDDQLSLSVGEFDIAFCIDKSRFSAGILKQVIVDQVYGFVVKDNVIIPNNESAHELWELGLDNKRKFFGNQKAETQLLHEALGLEFKRDPYVFQFTEDEMKEAKVRQIHWGNSKKLLVGINTGCGEMIPYRKFSINGHRRLIKKLQALDVGIVLLGGPSETDRNQDIACGLDVVESPTNSGIRDGMVSVMACDVIISGDSLGLHMGIALNKYVIAWFGPTVPGEIDLYENGLKIISKASCGPCWKRSCQKPVMCYDLVNYDKIVNGICKLIYRPSEFSI
jgi:heptosyltransferase II